MAYVCEGGGGLGWGHVNRARAMSEAAEAAGDEMQVVVGRGFDEVKAWARVAAGAMRVTAWRASGTPVDLTTDPYDVLIVDNYYVAGDWIAEAARRLSTFVVDDWMRTSVSATAVVNPNVGAARRDYPGATALGWLLGPEYVPLRHEVVAARRAGGRSPTPGEVLVTLGGSDPDDRSAQVARVLGGLDWVGLGGRLTVVLGASYAGRWAWQDWVAEGQGRRQAVVAPPDFVSRCAAADLVICSASTTTYELSYLARPFIPVALVDNQERVAVAWRDHGVGLGLSVRQADWLGRLTTATEQAMSDGAARARLASIVSPMVDGHGAARLLAACREASLSGRAPSWGT